MDYKDTVNLPKTSFPMKASLGKLEEELLERWEQEHIYQQLRQKFADRAKYILHDGPPYANGYIHLGTAFNKILKDFVVASRVWKATTLSTCRAGIAMAYPSNTRWTSNSAPRKRA